MAEVQDHAPWLHSRGLLCLHCMPMQAPAGPPKLVVFGGRGFVGSAVCKEALKTGLHVVSITPSGEHEGAQQRSAKKNGTAQHSTLIGWGNSMGRDMRTAANALMASVPCGTVL